MIEDIIKERIREIPISGFWYSESLWGRTFSTTLKLVSTALSHVVNENLIVRRISNLLKCIGTVSEQFFFWKSTRKSIQDSKNINEDFEKLCEILIKRQNPDTFIPTSYSYSFVIRKLCCNSLSIINILLIFVSTGLFELMSLNETKSGFDNPYYNTVFICDCLSALSSLIAQEYIRHTINIHKIRWETGNLLLEGFEKGLELEQQHGDPTLNPT